MRPALSGTKAPQSLTTRRILIGLTILLLLVVSAAVGVVVANWPQLFPAQASGDSQH